jgi:hypothetical protein
MKKILTATLAVLVSFFSATAQDDEKALVINASDIKHLVLGDNLNVVLLQHDNGPQEIKISKAVYSQLRLSMHDGIMTITSQNNYRSTEPVYVLVNQVKSLTLGENSRITTEGVLSAGKIDVYVEQGAKAYLRTTGKINATSLGDFDVSVERNAAGVAKVSDDQMGEPTVR